MLRNKREEGQDSIEEWIIEPNLITWDLIILEISSYIATGLELNRGIDKG